MRHDTAETSHDTAGLCVHAWPGQGQSRYKNCIVVEGRSLCRNIAQQGCDTTLRHGRARARYGAQCACGMDWVAIQFCIVIGGKGNNARTRRASAQRHDHDMAGHGLRHGALCATARSPAHAVRATWAQCARSLGQGCAPCSPNPVFTQDTVLNHCLGHCS